MLSARAARTACPIPQLSPRNRNLGRDGERIWVVHRGRNRLSMGSSFAIADCNDLAVLRPVAVCKAAPRLHPTLRATDPPIVRRGAACHSRPQTFASLGPD